MQKHMLIITDRLMLLVKMFAKLILLSVKETSDLRATFAMADHPPAERTCCPNPANTNGNGGPAHTQSQPPATDTHTHTHTLQPSGVRVEDDVDYGGARSCLIHCRTSLMRREIGSPSSIAASEQLLESESDRLRW